MSASSHFPFRYQVTNVPSQEECSQAMAVIKTASMALYHRGKAAGSEALERQRSQVNFHCHAWPAQL